MNCISRRDDKDKNLFVEKTDKKSRWNLYSQIAIENDMLICAKKAYNLTDICYFKSIGDNIETQTCTLHTERNWGLTGNRAELPHYSHV